MGRTDYIDLPDVPKGPLRQPPPRLPTPCTGRDFSANIHTSAPANDQAPRFLLPTWRWFVNTPLDRHTRRLAELIAPIVRTAAADPRTRQTALEAASKLTGRQGRELIGRLGEVSQPATHWLDTVRRSERRRRFRILGGRLGVLVAAGGLLASWMMKRPNHSYSHVSQVPNSPAAGEASSETSTARS